MGKTDVTYEDDFPKYRNKVDPALLRLTLQSAAVQVTSKFVYAKVGDYKAAEVQKALEMLYMAGILIPVTHTDANGLPLGSEASTSYRKVLLLDTGLMLRLLNMALGDISDLSTHIFTSAASELVNKGPMAELLAGLELLHYRTPDIRHELFIGFARVRMPLLRSTIFLSEIVRFFRSKLRPRYRVV